MQSEDQHIIQLLHDQDKYVISLLYDRYAPTLYGIVMRIVRSEAIAQDVLQEAFVKIWRNGPKYDTSKGALFTWMLNIARNTAIDKTRSANFRRSEKIQDLDHSVYNNIGLSETLNPDHVGIRGLVDKLDEKYRTIIDLIYFRGYTQKEIEEELNIPLGTVKSRLRIGLRELRKHFGELKIAIHLLWLICVGIN